jgi:hypothetical protein
MFYPGMQSAKSEEETSFITPTMNLRTVSTPNLNKLSSQLLEMNNFQELANSEEHKELLSKVVDELKFKSKLF